MKTLLLSAIAACISLMASAQSDQQKGDTTTQAPYENKVDDLYRKQEGMVAVQEQDIPQTLKSTLKHSRYRGWEKGELLRSADGKTYELRMGNGENNKVYRFDTDGKPLKKE
jgi:hypothetical protein